MLSLRRFRGCLDETIHNLEKSSRVRHVIDHEGGERFGNIQLNVSSLLNGGINIQPLRLQSQNEAVPVRLGNDSDTCITGLEGNCSKMSKGV